MKIKDLLSHQRRYMHWLRKCQQSKNKLSYYYYRIRMLCIGRKYGIEIGVNAKIGEDFQITHPFCITVSGESSIGDNCRIHKGVTIGAKNGTKDTWGAPKIGNKVYIGVNASIVGRITIGDDVLIAPNTFVNRDVPSHSIVLGNPMQIHSCEHATKYYI